MVPSRGGALIPDPGEFDQAGPNSCRPCNSCNGALLRRRPNPCSENSGRACPKSCNSCNSCNGGPGGALIRVPKILAGRAQQLVILVIVVTIVTLLGLAVQSEAGQE